LKEGSTIRANLSVGIAPLEWQSGVEAALEKADAALYQAKRNGRNCVYVWRPPLPALNVPAPDGAR
jgi:diguanylate cyclase